MTLKEQEVNKLNLYLSAVTVSDRAREITEKIFERIQIAPRGNEREDVELLIELIIEGKAERAGTGSALCDYLEIPRRHRAMSIDTLLKTELSECE